MSKRFGDTSYSLPKMEPRLFYDGVFVIQCGAYELVHGHVLHAQHSHPFFSFLGALGDDTTDCPCLEELHQENLG